MSSKTVFLLVLLSFILIFGTQVFLIIDYYNTTRAAWIKESNTVIEEAFRADLSIRNIKFRNFINEDDVIVGPIQPSEENTTFIDLSSERDNNVISVLDMAIHKHISNLVPLQLHQLDSVTSTILEAREIHSKFTVNLVRIASGEIIEASRDNWKSSLFLISSEPMLIPARRSRSAVLGPGDGMRRHEFSDMPLERGPGRRHHITLGRSSVGNQGIRPEIGDDTAEDLRHLRHRRGHQNDVGIADLMCRIDAGAIDDAQLLRDAQGAGSAAKAHHFLDRPCRFQGQGKGAANQAGTETTILPNSGWWPSIYCAPARTCSSASMKRAFSCAVPMVTRNQSGKP